MVQNHQETWKCKAATSVKLHVQFVTFLLWIYSVPNPRLMTSLWHHHGYFLLTPAESQTTFSTTVSTGGVRLFIANKRWNGKLVQCSFNAAAVTCVIIKELDVPVLLSCDGDWQRGMTQHFVDLAGSFCVEADVRRTTLTFKTNNLQSIRTQRSLREKVTLKTRCFSAEESFHEVNKSH